MAGSLNDKLFRTISEDTVSDPGGRTWVSGTVTANFSPAASQTVTFNQPVDVAVLDSATGTETNAKVLRFTTSMDIQETVPVYSKRELTWSFWVNFVNDAATPQSA